MARDCKKCKYFQGMHPNYNDSFACQLDPYCSWIEFKSEADEVIAELKNQVHEYAQGLYEIQSRTENEIRHGKYKRCLAMAEMCMFKSRISYFEKRSNKSRRMSKWCQRWLELAKKFNPNNSTAHLCKGK